MKVYIAVTGAAFALVTIAHVWRFVVERSVGHDPFFLALTALSAVLASWATGLLIRSSRS